MLNHARTVRLETERLILRRHEMADAGDMYNNWVTDPEVCRFWPWEPHKDIGETKAKLTEWIEEYLKSDYYHWIIELKDISQAVGYIYFADIDDTDDSVSVHYALSRKYWNRGLMTEALKCVTEFAFRVLGAKKIRSNHHIDNPASGRVLQKSGMRYVKIKYKRVPECERISGERLYYEITSEEWKRGDNGEL